MLNAAYRAGGTTSERYVYTRYFRCGISGRNHDAANAQSHSHASKNGAFIGLHQKLERE